MQTILSASLLESLAGRIACVTSRQFAEVFSGCVVREQIHVRVDHDADQLLESYFRFPIETLLRFRRITEQQVDLGGALVARVVFYELLPIQINMRESRLDELAHRVRFAGGQHEVVAFAELHNSPHPFDVLRCISPIAFCVQVAEEQFLLHALLNGGDSARNFAADESFATTRAFMVEQNAIARAKTVALPIVNGGPIRENLCHAIRTPRPEGRFLSLRRLLGLAEHFAARRLVKARTQSGFADCFQNANRADASDVGSVLRNIEAHAHVALRAQMIDLVRLQFVKKLHKIHRVAEVAVMQKQSYIVYVWISVEMVNSGGVERAGASNDSVDFVALLKQQIRQITSVLTGDAGDQC